MKKLLKILAVTTSALALLLTLFPIRSAHATYSGLNGRIFFVSNRDGDNEIFSMRSDGTSVTQLTNNSTDDGVSAVSPDGLTVLFHTNRDGNYEIYKMRPDGSNQQRVIPNTGSDTSAHMSPDGSKITFVNDAGLNQEIYTMNSDGTNIVKIISSTPSSGVYNRIPKWSPDGSKITFRSNRNGTGNMIFKADADGSNITGLTIGNGFSNGGSDWHPTGQKIAFTAANNPGNQIYIMNVDGSSQTRLTTVASDYDPSWSPDATRISMWGVKDGNNEIYIMDTNGSNYTRLTNNPASDVNPVFQPLTITPNTTNTSLTLDATNSPVIYNAPANHTDSYEEIDPTSVTITTQPKKGSVVVDASTGGITYAQNKQASVGSFLSNLDKLLFKPASAQAANQDSFTYQICSTANSQLCTQTTVTVNLAAATSLAATGSDVTNNLLVVSLVLFGAASLRFVRKRCFI